MTQALAVADPVEYTDGWLKYDIPGTSFFINASPKGTSFHVLEASACPMGMAYTHGRRGSLKAALTLAAGLRPSTVGEIISRVKAACPGNDDRLDRLAFLAEPGRRLWTLPVYQADGYHGLGEAATAAGLHASGIESLFGSPLSVWTAAYVTDSGREGHCSPLVLSELAEAREKWWILSHDGHDLVSGGHADRARMQCLAAEKHPGSQVVQGCMFIREDGSVFTTLVSLAEHLDGWSE